ncbi:receptor-like protein 15 isoform X2 [Brassica napus]|uniref:receptor-like protein 15 isoform X2 n=1 Tax=Brassica napus TaxID=3708 RepID=UPI000BBE8E72|nr:receptor-like protein 15 isoform X2 [Brassica napus]
MEGVIPSWMGEFTSLTVILLSNNSLEGAQTKIEFATKHRYDAYMGANLQNFSGLELSENELSGEIPVKLGGLLKLHVLNLSYNYLSGVIPRSFSGVIPQGRQFNTFDMQSYLGNPLLCGQPTNISCNGKEQDNNGVKYDESTIDMVSFYWSCTAAYVTLLFGILASLSFESSWRRAWFLCVVTSVFKYLQVYVFGIIPSMDIC